MNQSPNSSPLIGITTYGRDKENHFTLPGEYVDAVRRAGGIPVLIPAGETEIDALLARLDGLILAGGGDVDPELYAGNNHIEIYMIDPERDSSELALARTVAANGTPTGHLSGDSGLECGVGRLVGGASARRSGGGHHPPQPAAGTRPG